MTKLDIEELYQRVLMQMQPGQLKQDVLAALKDRDRLRAALQKIVEITTADRLQVGTVARAALEGRDD